MALGGSNYTSTVTFVGKDGVSGTLNTLQKNMTKLGGPKFGSIGNLISGFASMSLASLGVAGGFGAVTGVLIDSAKAAIDEQKSIDQLNVSLKDNVTGWDGNTTAVEAAIKAGEALAFNADDQRSALALLLASTHDVSKATALLSESEDLARLKGIDLATAAGVIQKVYNGNVSILTRYGIAITKGSTATQALAQIQAAAAGQADAYGNSTQGAMDKAAIAWHEAEVSIGTVLLPLITDAANGITSLIGDVGNLGTAFDNLRRFLDPTYAQWEDMNKAITAQGTALGLTAQQIDYITSHLGQAAPVVDTYTKSVGSSRSAITDAGIAAEKTSQDLRAQTQATLAAQAAIEPYTKAIAANALITTTLGLANGSLVPKLQDTSSAFTGLDTHTAAALANVQRRLAAMRAFDGLPAAAEKAVLLAAADVGQLPVLMSQQLRAGVEAVKKAMIAYKLAIDDPLTLAKADAFIEAKATSKKIREGLKSQNQQVRADTIAQVQWLADEYQKLNGVAAPWLLGFLQGNRKPNDAHVHRASGGPVYPGEAYTVGENGPETLVMGNQGGNVIAHGAGGNIEHTTNVYLDGEVIAKQVDRWQGRHRNLARAS